MKLYLKIASAGAVGGLLAWLFGISQSDVVTLKDWGNLPAFVALGSGASVVFIYLIANTDKSDIHRALTLAVVSGFFWKPVWQASEALITQRVQESRQDKLVSMANDALVTANAIRTAEPNDRKELESRFSDQMTSANQMAAGVDSVTFLKKYDSIMSDIEREARNQPEFYERYGPTIRSFRRATSPVVEDN